jgi:hypothetical protein
MTEGLSQAAVEDLTTHLLFAIRCHFRARQGRDGAVTICEALNALAAVSAAIIRDTDMGSREFFEKAYRRNLDDA